MAKCLNCDREFEAKRSDAKCCSAKCRVTFNRKRNIVTDKPVTDSKTQAGEIKCVGAPQVGPVVVRDLYPNRPSLSEQPKTNKTIDGAMRMRAEAADYVMGRKVFKTRQESDAEFTRLMAQDDRSRPNKRVSKPGDEDYPAQTGTKKCWCCGEVLEWDVLVCCGPCAWSGKAKREREAGRGPDADRSDIDRLHDVIDDVVMRAVGAEE